MTANKVMLMGTLVREPRINVVQNSGMKIASFTLAVDDSYQDRNGQAVSRANFPTVKAFGKMAEKVEHLTKGAPIGVIGKIVTGSYVDSKSGRKVYTTDVQAEGIEVYVLQAGQQTQPQDDGYGDMYPESMSMPAPQSFQPSGANGSVSDVPF